jgi:hypothetical protein
MPRFVKVDANVAHSVAHLGEEDNMTGEELKNARHLIGDYLGERISLADMARLIGLADPSGNGKDTVRKWEDGDGPPGPVAVLVGLIVEGLSIDPATTRDYAVIFQWFVDFVERRIGKTPL